MECKIIANYLPQFHTIPENDKWWGEGFTDWIAVKNAIPLFEGHDEPRVPLGNHYYDLSQKEAVAEQAELAVRYGIYGFGIYHYWFSSKMNLLHKPAEIILQNTDINIHYMFIWDNASWKRTWSNVKGYTNDWAPAFDVGKDHSMKEKGLLAELCYGGEQEWKAHFEYLLPYFRDERYIKINGRPAFAIFSQVNEPEILAEMIQYWNELARNDGFQGITILGRHNSRNISVADYEFYYEPMWHGWVWHNQAERIKNKIYETWCRNMKKPGVFRYDHIWNRIIHTAEKADDTKVFYSGFVSYDDTPRRGRKGKLILGGTPEKFRYYLEQLLNISNKQNKEYLFLTAWNEWGEGAYLEPDMVNGYAYLEAVKKALEAMGKNG